MKKRRIYVMDCGDFVKIGVSLNPNQRKNQIPYEVKKYYSTEPIENVFEIERFMHKVFKPVIKLNVEGREYFSMDFDVVCDVLNNGIKADEARRDLVLEAIQELSTQNDCKRKFDTDFYNFISIVLKLSIPDLFLVERFASALVARRQMLDMQEEKDKELADQKGEIV